MRLKEQDNLLIVEQKNIFLRLFYGIFSAAGIAVIIFSGELIIGALFIIMPLLLAITTVSEKVVADYNTQLLTISKKSVIKKTEKQIAFRDLVRIEVREKIKKNREGRQSTSYPLYGILKNGNEEHLIEELGKSITFVDTAKNEREIGQKLAERIGVSFVEIKAPTLSETITLVKEQFEKNKQEYINKPHS